MTQLIDFSAALIEPEAIRAAGFGGAILYMSDRRPGAEWMKAKPATRAYCDAMRAAGLEVVSCYQYGKGDTSDWFGAYDGGCRHAEIALRRHFEAGGAPYRPLYAPVDANPTLQQWNTYISPFLKGWNSVVGLEWTGMYGNSRCIDWALEDQVAQWFWQHNWSGDASINGHHPAAHLHQIEIDKRTVGGVGVDVNEALKPDYGQWSRAAAPVAPSRPGTGVIVVNKPAYMEIDYYGDSNSSRHGARVSNGLGHTQEGGAPDGSDAEGLADYLRNLANQVSYHDVIGAGRVFHVSPKDRASWSVLDANPYSINYCLAGSRAGFSREQWMTRRDDVRIMAWLMVQDAKAAGFDPAVIAPPYERRDGLSDHYYVTKALGIGNHTDLGREFIWDVLVADVAEFATGAVEPVINMIDQEAERTASWIGARVTDEIPTPDGEGRRAEFEHGQIYWHPRTGAHAIPTALFETYASRGWEAGPLGYPIGDHTVLTGPDGQPWGDVQGFENGALYRRYGFDGVWVHGEIRARWNRTGFENGQFGWPVSDEEPFDTGARQRFEHGYIYWPNRPTLALLDADGPDTPVPDAQG